MELLNPCDKTVYPAYTATYTGVVGHTSDWLPGPQAVIVWSDQDCYIEVGVGAVATTASTPIPASTPIYIAVPVDTSGAPWRVSAIQISAGGIAYCKPLNRN